MSFVGTLKITVRALTGLPAGTSSVRFAARIKSRKEHGVSKARKVCVGPLAVSAAGDVVADASRPACMTVHTPFPGEDVVHITVGTAERAALFAFGNASVCAFAKAPHTERTLGLKDPKTRSAVGTVSVAVDYVPPEVVLTEAETVERLNAAAAQDTPHSDDSFTSTPSSLTHTGSDCPPSPDASTASRSHGGSPAPAETEAPGPAATPLPPGASAVSGCRQPRAKKSPVMPKRMPDTPKALPARGSPLAVVPEHQSRGDRPASLRSVAQDSSLPREYRPSARVIKPLPQSTPDAPVAVTPCTGLTFGLESRQAPLDTPLRQNVLLENTSSKEVCFRFDMHNNEPLKYTVTAEPSEGTLAPGQQLSVALTLVVHCTTHLQLALLLQLWQGGPQDDSTVPTATVVLTGGIQSRLSTRLDPDEIQVFSSIGNGAFGAVYRGKYRGFDVAVKLFKNQAKPSPALLRDFKAEVEMAESLRHTCITTFVGAVHNPGALALVTEFCPFGNLSAALTRYPFSPVLKLKALLDVARAIDYLHQSGLLHRDLKTENILVVSLEPRSQVVCKVSDFGTARDLNSCALLEELELTNGVGTPIFMAPEIYMGKSYTESADIYSFGILMCHVANGECPYTNDRRFTNLYTFWQCVTKGMRPKLKAETSPEFVKLMSSCWDANPMLRPPSYKLSRALEEMFRAEEAKSLSG